ncbi:hypothetical protein BGLT_02194 [Caballeronia glathei]|uniref:hypothetical protein n=1 Tax=Caballeronia glathei TaxID=60547 RepID=UPI000504D5AE|nr:hypothetical protein [Caballeronia glathei]CDY79413.1 hypothetical protein BGLT_02194 [Caballeronia glathei]
MEFEYKRDKGERHTYRVSLQITRDPDDGSLGYVAKVHRGEDYLGELKPIRLRETDVDEAFAEARAFVVRDIDDLVGIRE